MLHLRAAKWAALVHLLLLLFVLAPSALAQVNLAGKDGTITIGRNAPGSTGEVNVPLTGEAHSRAVQDAVFALAEVGAGTLQFLPGDYYLDAPIVISSPLEVRLDPGAVLRPRGSAAVGLFDFQQTERAVISGDGKILVDRWVDDQHVVRFQACGFSGIRGVTFEVSTDEGDGANAMNLVRITDCYNTEVDGVTFLPNVGIRCIYSDLGLRTMVRNSHFTNGVEGQVANPGGDQFTTRSCYEVWRSIGEGWNELVNCRFWGLGDHDADPVDVLNECIFMQGPAGTTEDGHVLIQGNYWEEVAARNYLNLWGVIHGNITGNTMANPDGAINTLNSGAGRWDAAIRLDSSDGTNTGTFGGRIVVAANEFHRCSEDGGVTILARRTRHLAITACLFGLLTADTTIWIDVDTVQNATVQGCTFDGDSTGNTEYAVEPAHTVVGTFPSQLNLFMGNNLAEQFSAANPFYASVLGRVFPFGTNYDSARSRAAVANAIGFANTGTITHAALSAITPTNVTVAAGGTLTRAAGDWTAGGIAAGDKVRLTAPEDASNRGVFNVLNVTATVLTLDGSFVANADDDTITVTELPFGNIRVGDYVFPRVTLVADGTTSDPFVQTIYRVTSVSDTALGVTPSPAVNVSAAATKNVELSVFPTGINTNLVRDQTTPP